MASRSAYRDAPVSETCPDIDKVISMLEELRSANQKLREWGSDLYDKAQQLESDLDEAKDTISDLQSEVDSLNEELKEVATK